MGRALEVLEKSSPSKPQQRSRGRRAQERRLGKKPGDVRGRTIIGGRSYDHVQTTNSGDCELHPTNLEQALGTITHTSANTFIARAKGEDLGEHADRHKAARAIVGHTRGILGLGSNSAAGAGDSDDSGGPSIDSWSGGDVWDA